MVACDFLSFDELGKPPRGCPCERKGLSLFSDRRDAEHYMGKFPYLGSRIARATLRPWHGKQKATPRRGGPSHTTWWPFEDVVRHELFAVV